jgi:hypothetical protein
MSDDEKELRRRLEALRLKHNDANELGLTHDCLFADLIAAVEILARRLPGITDPQKPFAGNDHPHEVGSGCCDRLPPPTTHLRGKDKPFPLPGQTWEFDGTDQGPHVVTGLRWFHGNTEAVFECGVAGIRHMMEDDRWTCRVPLTITDTKPPTKPLIGNVYTCSACGNTLNANGHGHALDCTYRAYE